MKNIDKFTWIEIHKGLIDYLKDKKSKQAELIKLLKSINININKLDKRDIQGIDPFSFIRHLYKARPRDKTKTNYGLINLNNLAQKLNLPKAKDTYGIPSVRGNLVLVFKNFENQKKGIEYLWKFFNMLTDQNSNNMTTEFNFMSDKIGFATLTDCLFYYKPDQYLPIDSVTIEYINSKLRQENIKAGKKYKYDEYIKILENLKNIFPKKTFYHISHDAYIYSNRIKSEINNRTKKYSTNHLTTKSNLQKMKMLNQILYGPPGTGKTYMSIREAINIIKPDFKVDESKELEQKEKEEKAEFERLRNEGKIEFITFHQSMTYEDFIEGIKPSIKEDDEFEVNIQQQETLEYKIVPGIFKNICVDASYYYYKQKNPEDSAKALDFISKYDKFISNINDRLFNSGSVELLTKQGSTIKIESISKRNNIILKHSNGLNEYIVSKERLRKLNSEIQDLKDISNINDKITSIIGGCNVTAYWTILNEFRNFNPPTNSNSKNDIIDINSKIEAIKTLSKDDYKIDSPDKYVLIIDEINRGNISQIFGELITLIEDDKRLGNKEALEVTLPYSKEKFGVPPNLYIIGTMNTADRSIEALDTALRRRFSFREYKPESKPIENKIINDISLKDLLKKINERLELLLDKDHLIGHSYFMEVTNIDDLKDVFQDKIIPLLQEYFYGDFGKIGLVLGKNFFENEGKQDKTKTDFAHFPSYEDTDDLKERKVYRLNNVKEMNDEEFGKAIEELLGNNGKQNEQE